MDELRDSFFRNIISGVVVSSMYIVTFSTIYFNEFDPTYYPIYNILSNVFGFSLALCAIATAYSLLYKLPLYVNFSIVALVGYNCLNIGFSLASIVDPKTTFASVFPTVETYSNAVFGSVCTFLYAKSFFNGT